MGTVFLEMTNVSARQCLHDFQIRDGHDKWRQQQQQCPRTQRRTRIQHRRLALTLQCGLYTPETFSIGPIVCLLQTTDCLPGQLLLVLSGQKTEDSVHLLLKLGAIESSRSNCRDEQNCACPLTSLGPSRLLPTVASPFPEQAHLNGPFRWLVVMAQCQHGRHRGGSLKKKKREKTRPSSEHTERLVIRHSISGYFFARDKDNNAWAQQWLQY